MILTSVRFRCGFNVRHIREAKKNRQVILVTHNPNLAVRADAEQVFYVKLEKAKNYKFSYATGAIENPELIDVLLMY